MHRYTHLSLLFICFFSSLFFISAQDKERFTNEALAEKVYVQIDRNIYKSDETIWFKAVLVNTSTHQSNRTSSVLYVDLINSKNEIVKRKLVNIRNGIGQGQIDLSTSMESGIYLLRAYTQWNKNFSANFNYEKYIQVFSDNKEGQVLLPVQNVKRNSLKDLDQITMDLYPKSIDADHSGKLMVLVENDRLRDTLNIKASDGRYGFVYELDKNYKELTVKLLTSSGKTYAQNIGFDDGSIDLQFFPEGGKLISGFSSRIGYKALGSDGRGKLIEGFVKDTNGQVIVSFKSDSLGMGSFVLPELKVMDNYTVEAKVPYLESFQYDIPQVHATGTTMSVTYDSEMIFIKIFSNLLKTDEINLRGWCRGYKYFDEKYKLKDGFLELVVPKSRFPEGVVALTLYVNNERPLSERLFFNERLERRLNLNLEFSKSTLRPREKCEISVLVRAQNEEPLEANVSTLVISKEELPNFRMLKQNILSHLLLSSELKGTIENPTLYFNETMDYNVDNLMLTQGWRDFKYTQNLKNNSFEMEKNLKVNGVVNITKSRTDKEPVDLTVIAFDKDRTVYNFSVNAPANFSFDLLDTYGDQIDLGFQASGERKISNYLIAINKTAIPEPKFNYNELILAQDSVRASIIKEQNKKVVLDYQGVTQLEEVQLEGYVMTPKRKEISERYGMPDIVIEGEEIRKSEQNWSYGLFSVLQSFFRDKVKVDFGLDGVPRVSSIREYGKSGFPTLITVDGVPVNRFEFQILQNIRVDQVKSFEIIDNASNFSTLYRMVYPGSTGQIPSRGSVIVIYTKEGKGIYGAVRPSNQDMKIETIPVFSVEREFYVPKYDIEDSDEDLLPDLRSPVFWQPQLITNTRGEASLNYYHSDNLGRFVLIVEAISNTGQIGYKELEYEVKKN